MSKKLLKSLEGSTIEKITVDAATRKVKIKSSAGTITIEMDDYLEAGSELGREPVANISFKEAKAAALPVAKPAEYQDPRKALWPFPTGNKP